MKKIFTLTVFIVTFFSNAQEIIILDQTTHETISGVAVFNTSKTKSAFSGLDGKVAIDVFSRNEKITFQHLGHVAISIFKSQIKNVVYLTPQEQGLDEIVISASKFEQSKREVPQKIISIKARDIALANPQTSADLLGSSGQVFIQKSQLGGGSPMIRGFSTNRLLISVDDVRMNTAIFRGGNLQNVISIDPFSVQNTEVILGAGSVIYGSDAIGGVMNFYTKNPQLSSSNNLQFNANLISRYATASNEKTGHIDVNLGWEKWASLTSISYTDFDDLKMGKHGPSEYLRPEYVETKHGIDVIRQNSDPRVQKFTGYNQINFLEKLHYQADETLSFDLGLHYTATSNYPRYDRLIRYRGSNLRSAEWSYGPQKWFLGNLKLTKYSSKSNLYDKIKATVAYQNFQESRIDRNLNAEYRNDRKEKVDVLSGNLDFEKSVSEHSNIFYGFEYLYNKVHSTGKEINIVTNETQTVASRYPNGASWQSAAAYVSYKFKPNRKFTFQSGIRYNHIKINADFSDNNKFYNFPFNDADLSTGAFTATAGISWSPNDILQWKLNGTSAFRAPNIDDIGKVFDSEPGSVVVPNANLKPEYAYGGELGLALNFNDDVILDVSTYYTYLDNALVRRAFMVNGNSQMMYDGELSDIQAIQNASKAWIYGFEAGVKIAFSDELQLTSQYSVVGGTEEEKGGVEMPVRHVAPSFGNTHITWQRNRFKCDAFTTYNGELSFYQLAPSEADKDYIYAKDANGNPYAPSWYTLNFRSQYNISKSTSVTATVENITNQLYRPYSSGVSASGTNVIVSVMYSL